MRVFLTSPELETEAGKHLLELTLRIATDGKLDLAEIKELRNWLGTTKDTEAISAIGYLCNIMDRITSDGVIDREELTELHLAVERVIPATHRTQAVQARNRHDSARRQRREELRRIEEEKAKQERKRHREEEYARQNRLRHCFAKVAGVTFPNDDGSERQDIIKHCQPGEQLILRHDAYSDYSVFATQVLRTNGEQLGHAPEYLAERICNELEEGYQVFGMLMNITGGTWDKPICGVNFVTVFFAPDVTGTELQGFADAVLSAQS